MYCQLTPQTFSWNITIPSNNLLVTYNPNSFANSHILKIIWPPYLQNKFDPDQQVFSFLNQANMFCDLIPPNHYTNKKYCYPCLPPQILAV